ncbi:hypothetical protein ACFX2I_029625 [Malus domestica]
MRLQEDQSIKEELLLSDGTPRKREPQCKQLGFPSSSPCGVFDTTCKSKSETCDLKSRKLTNLKALKSTNDGMINQEYLNRTEETWKSVASLPLSTNFTKTSAKSTK